MDLIRLSVDERIYVKMRHDRELRGRLHVSGNNFVSNFLLVPQHNCWSAGSFINFKIYLNTLLQLRCYFVIVCKDSHSTQIRRESECT